MADHNQSALPEESEEETLKAVDGALYRAAAALQATGSPLVMKLMRGIESRLCEVQQMAAAERRHGVYLNAHAGGQELDLRSSPKKPTDFH